MSFQEPGRMPCRLTGKMTFAELEEIVGRKPDDIVVVGTRSCWWGRKATSCVYRTAGDHGLPCDPRGHVLMEMMTGEFLDQAADNPAHYGRHGLVALLAAYHGNLVDASGRPWCFADWAAYGYYIEQHAATLAAQEEMP